MLICLGWQGYLENYIPKLVLILNYKPIELTVKLREMVKKEASSISPFDMEFYSEVTKDLQLVLGEKDAEIAKSELQMSQAAPAAEAAVEETKVDEPKSAEPVKTLTPAQL
jgi:hypothetical protein